MDEQLIPELFDVATQSIIENASRLGLTWTLQLATVLDGTNPPRTVAVFDSDSETEITMTSMIGSLPALARVYVMRIPPSGNFIIGSTDFTNALPNATTGVIEGPVGTTTSSSFADFPTSPVLELNKRYGSGSQLLFTVIGTAWANGSAGTTGQLQAGVTVEGTDWALNFLNYNTLASHMTWGGQRQIDAAAGPGSFPLRWRRPGGTATITVDGADWVSFSVVEVPIL